VAHSFADKLDRLFTTVRREDGSAYSITDVAAAITAQGQTKLSASYLSELRSGRKDHPNIWVADALARFFGQPIEYFVEAGMEPVQPGKRAAPAAGGAAISSLAERLNTLIRLAEPHGVTDPSDDQLARWMAQAGHPVAAAAISAARSGESAEPAAELVDQLAAYFEVPAAFLTDAAVAEAMAPQLRLMRMLKDQQVRRIAFRASNLDASDRDRVADLIARLSQAELGDDDIDF
jgi:transcriptional regulator with XRE-family HTH domain